MADDCAQLQTEAPMGGQEHITGHVRTHVAIAQDEVGEHREYRFTRVHWMRQMVSPPNRTEQWEWRIRHPPPVQVALRVS